MYTSGVWNVKPGCEDDFVRGWQTGVDRMSPDLTGVTFRLLRDREIPSRFVSVAGPWRNQEQWDAIRASEGFQESMSTMTQLLDSYEIAIHDLVAEVS